MLNTNSGDRKTFFRDVLQDRLNEGNYRIKNINDIKLIHILESKTSDGLWTT